MFDTILTALTAAGGNSRAARSARARLQWRDRYGRWIEMGRGVKFKVRGSDGAARSVIGSFVGAVDANTGQVFVQKDPNGLPDGFYDVSSNNAQEFVANLDESQLAERGIELGKDAEGRAVGERVAEDIPNVNELTAKSAPEGWVAQQGLYGGKKVIQTDDGDFRIHYSGKDDTVLLEDHRANPGQAEPQRSLAEAFKKVSDVDIQREEGGDQAYVGLSEGNDEKLASRSRDDKVEQIKANERTLLNDRAPLNAKQTAMDINNQLKAELESEGQPYDPEGNDSDEALAARKAAPEGAAEGTDPAAPSTDSAPVSAADIDTSTFDVAPEGFLVPTGKRTEDITPEGLANFMTAEKESLGKGGARLVVDTTNNNAEIYNSADTYDNARAQAGGLGQDTVLDLANGKAVSVSDNAVDPNSPDVNPNLEGDTSPEAPNAENRDPNAVEPGTAQPGADAPTGDQPDAEAQRSPEPAQPAGDAAPERAAEPAGEPDLPAATGDRAADAPTKRVAPSGWGYDARQEARRQAREDYDASVARREAEGEDPWAPAGDPLPAPGSVEDLKDRRAKVQTALDNAGDPKDIIALNEQADALDNRIRSNEDIPRDDPRRFQDGVPAPDAQQPDSWDPVEPNAPETPDNEARLTELADEIRKLQDEDKALQDRLNAAPDGEESDRISGEIDQMFERISALEAEYENLNNGTADTPEADTTPAVDVNNWAENPTRPTKDEISNAPAGALLGEEHNESGDVRLFRKREDGKWEQLKRDGSGEPSGYVTRGDHFTSQGSVSHFATNESGDRPRDPDVQQRLEENAAAARGEDVAEPVDAPAAPEEAPAAPGPEADAPEAPEAPESADDPTIPPADQLVAKYDNLPAGELSVGDIIIHPGTGNAVRITGIEFEYDERENDTRFQFDYASRNEEEGAENEAAEYPIEMWQSWRDAAKMGPGDPAPEPTPEPDVTPEPEPEAPVDDPWTSGMKKRLAGEPVTPDEQAAMDAEDARRAALTPQDRLDAANKALADAEVAYNETLLKDDYTEEEYDQVESMREWARYEQRQAQEDVDYEELGSIEDTLNSMQNEDTVAPALTSARRILEDANERELTLSSVSGSEGTGGVFDRGDDPFNVSSGHSNSVEVAKAKMQGKQLTDEERADLTEALNSGILSDNDLAKINREIDSKPNAANTGTVARPDTEQPEYMSTADMDIVNAERDDPNFVFDEDLTWRRIFEEFPDLTELANGDLVLDTAVNKGKRYDTIIRRTNKNRFLVYIMETDGLGERRAKRIGNTEWHSYEALEKRIAAGRKLIHSSSPAGSLARRKDQPTERLGTQNFPQDDFLGDIGNPDAPVPATGDEKFDRLLEAVAQHIRNGDVDLNGIETHLQDIDPGANAINTIMNAVIGRAQDTYRPDGVNPFQMYDGETAQIGDYFDWTDWHQELNWWLPDGTLNPDRIANPTHGLVGRGRVVGYVKENTDGKGHTYGDHVWVQMLQPDGTWGNWVKRSAQTLRRVEDGDPLSSPFFSKREEWRTNPEELARRFRVPNASPEEPVQTKERPRRDLPASRRIRFTSRGNLSGYSNVPVPNSPSEIMGMITRNEVTPAIRPANEARAGMMIARMDDDGNQFVDSIIRVENLGDGGYRIHAARPDGNGYADVDSFIVPGDADIAIWSAPALPAPREAEPKNARRGELVEFEQGNGLVRGVVAFDDDKGNLTVITPGNEVIDILESNITPVEDPEVTADERTDLLDSFDEYELPQFIQQMIQQGILSPGLTRERYEALNRIARAFRPRSSLMRLIEKILDMIGANDQQRSDVRDYFNR